MERALSWFLVTSLLLGVSFSVAQPTNTATEENEENGTWAPDGAEMTLSLRRQLRHRNRLEAMTCDRASKVCRLRGSPGRDCCRKRCVNLKTDVFNCGRCGNRCGYGKACCRGRCVNILFNRKNCGACNRRCGKRNKCFYGMCNYA